MARIASEQRMAVRYALGDGNEIQKGEKRGEGGTQSIICNSNWHTPLSSTRLMLIQADYDDTIHPRNE